MKIHRAGSSSYLVSVTDSLHSNHISMVRLVTPFLISHIMPEHIEIGTIHIRKFFGTTFSLRGELEIIPLHSDSGGNG